MGGFTIIAYLISQDEYYREGFKKLLEITIPKLTIKAFAEMPAKIQSDVALVIIEPVFEEKRNRNIEDIEHLANSYHARTCLLLDSPNNDKLLQLLNNKVYGVFFKSDYTFDLVEGLKEVLKGERYIPGSVAKILLEVYQQ